MTKFIRNVFAIKVKCTSTIRFRSHELRTCRKILNLPYILRLTLYVIRYK
jgi:hypothetical protein